eukprot:CAMPEP_0175043476 /NCGR_PEP_ID=MMETSP0052_2-20121109/3214_1 /TAXON_ID=51329 ORGANISM="Polytomella parva, Strain SAG 63-3" /NCGR_SAMPLE_ID=MMETSP0052_2 /ASSEMBLY_ACC=CAM_ASM_000194 /LENGTH=382 /DNA_ID=CAMNT_0016306551 /DNA_START=59 /DNA_END=1207 /DNA_ORIENTATION=-
MDFDLKFETLKFIRSQDDDILVLTNIVVASVPLKFGNNLIRQLTSKYPLDSLKHLKRVKKKSEERLEIVVCEAPFPDFVIQQLKDDSVINLYPALKFIKDNNIDDIYITKASNSPPRDKTNVPKWNEYWPILWRIPDNLSEVELNPTSLISAQPYFEKYMNIACNKFFKSFICDDSTESVVTKVSTELSTCCTNSAIIVDPATSLIIGEGFDRTNIHPLDHAVMVAIKDVANKILIVESQTVIGAKKMADPLSHEDESENAEMEKEAKRQRLNEGNEECISSSSFHLQTLEAKSTLEESATCQVRAKVDRPYMCTGLDCFVVREPCVMCAMAMVHSRIQRVVYCIPDLEFGALGGKFKLHSQRTLNHHYEVFHLPQKEISNI